MTMEAEFGKDVANFVRRDSYVDDGVKSVPTIEEAVHIIDNTKEMLRRGGLRLHKFLSSSKNVLQNMPLADRAQGLKDIDVLQDQLPVERALGVQWCIESDTFQFRITLNDRPLTRRGVLSTLCSVYDPLGFIAPFILVGKQILQQMCKDKTDWDSPLSDDLSARWLRWRLDLNNLKDLKVNRCLKPSDFGETVSVELHHFSDASTQGYGQCSYVRLVNTDGRIHCALVMGKARVIPLKPITIPRSELVAALVSVRMSSMLIRELDYMDRAFLWETDPLASCDTQSVPSLSFKDPEVKKAQVFETATTPVEEKPLIDRLDAFSDWQRAKKAVALCLKEIEYLHTAEASHSCDSKQKVCLKSSSSLCGLDPFLDDNGILRVSGRIKHGDFDASVKHPIILPRKSHVTKLVIRHYHERVEHQGRGITTGEIRANGFWIVGCSSAVSSYISKCVTCLKLRGITQGQRMADLPADRLSPEPPFTYSGVDFFGPFYIKEGRKELKRYGVIFTCMSSRAIHVETANSLDTSSFINALRRFLAIRGPVRQLRSDRGTNLVGAEHELREELEGLDDYQL
ncbi:uncharacterized protein [Argopecten irradians]|uniref:uncharacterized protein n=1 Tax=Argopecten irradians TaxID=31199 RepID=UPI00371C6FBB